MNYFNLPKILSLTLASVLVSITVAQAPDGFPDTFLSTGSGTDWNDPNSWIGLDGVEVGGADEIPDGDDIVIINHNINVTADAGFGELIIENTTTTSFTVTVQSGVSLTGFNTFYVGNASLRSTSTSTTFTTLVVDNGVFTCTDMSFEAPNSGRCTFSVINAGEANFDGNITFSGAAANRNRLQTLTGSNNVINLLGNITGSGSINLGFNSTASTINFNGSAAQTIPSGGAFARYSNIVINNTAGVSLTGNIVTPFSSNSAVSNLYGSITIQSGFLNDAGFNISLPGNFVNNGDPFNQSVGSTLTFSGSAAQVMTGTNNIQNLTLNNAAGLSFTSGTLTIQEQLNATSGTLTNTGASVTLLSNTTGTAQLGDLTNGGYSGDLTVQRRFSKSGQGYMSVTTPVGGTTLADWNDGGISPGQEVLFSGFTGSNYPTFPFNNAYTYQETLSGADKNDGWIGATNMSDPTGVDNSHRGWFIYGDAVVYNLSVTGEPNTGDVSIPLNYTASGGLANDGWNFVGNPFPCTIDWELIRGGLVEIYDFYSVYSSDAGNFVYYEGGVGGTNGGTQYIPSSQAFWVQATGPSAIASFDISESHKNPNQDPTFIKSNNVAPLKFRIEGTVNDFYDEGFLIADASYDNELTGLDRSKMETYTPDVSPTIYTETTDGGKVAINKISNMQSVDIPLMAKSGTAALGQYTLSFEVPDLFFENACITLEDLHTGNLTNLRADTAYSFMSSDTVTVPRFVIHITQALSTDITDAICSNSADGQVMVYANGLTGSDVSIRDLNGNILQSFTANSDSTVFSGLEVGNYILSANYVSACGGTVNDVNIEIESSSVLMADFAIPSTISLGDDVFDFITDNSSGATTYHWDFGDGNTSSDMLPSYTYSNDGTYTITLTITNNDGCTDTYSKQVNVGGTVGIENVSESDLNIQYMENNLIVTSDFIDFTVVNLELRDITGKVIQSFGTRQLKDNQVIIPVDEFTSGVYFVVAEYDAKLSAEKIIIE